MPTHYSDLCIKSSNTTPDLDANVTSDIIGDPFGYTFSFDDEVGLSSSFKGGLPGATKNGSTAHFGNTNANNGGDRDTQGTMNSERMHPAKI